MKVAMKSRMGDGTREVGYGDPVYVTVLARRVRFSKVETDGMVEVMEDDGRKLPDLWHPSQVLANF